jgi:glycosyltransferase involved in cell wall biosynthesis
MIMSALPLVSVIIPTYNYGDLLQRSILSVLNQKLPSELREIIVVDDGSTDNTAQVLAEFGSKIRLIHQKNSGQAAAINHAIELANGEIVSFLDPDDEWYPNKLERVIAEFQDLEVGMVQHALDVQKSISGSSFQLQDQLSSGIMKERALTSEFRCNPTSALSFRFKSLKKILPAPVELRTGGFDLYSCILVSLISKIVAIPEALGVYWVHGKNNFTNNPTAFSFKQQILTIETVRKHAKALALANGMKIPEGFESNFYSEYPAFCRINLAWQEKKHLQIPGYFWDYFQKYAVLEYGWSLRLLRRSFRLAACSVLPPKIYRKLGFYSHA